MFLLKRKKDGLFWRNRSSHSFSHWTKDGREGEWVSNPSLCKPFATEAAAKISRGSSIKPPFSGPKNPMDEKAWTEYYAKHRTWYSASNLPARNVAFQKQYEIVEVVVKIK